MRLAQMARKLGVRPSEIVALLASNNIAVDEKSNARLLEDHVVLIRKHYGDADVEVLESVSPEVDQGANKVVEPPEAVGEETVETEKSEESKAEIIRATRVELSGLKVMGKIELPEPKKKSPSEAPIGDEKAVSPEPKRFSSPKNLPREERSRKNPIAQQRERESQEKIKEREDRARQAKEQRTRSYQNRVKTSPPTKRAKLVDEHTEVIADIRPIPKTWVGKFVRWLST